MDASLCVEPTLVVRMARFAAHGSLLCKKTTAPTRFGSEGYKQFEVVASDLSVTDITSDVRVLTCNVICHWGLSSSLQGLLKENEITPDCAPLVKTLCLLQTPNKTSLGIFS